MTASKFPASVVASSLCAVSLAALSMAFASPALAGSTGFHPKGREWAAVAAAYTDQISLLQTLVDIDSGSGEVEGGQAIADTLQVQLTKLGAHVERVSAEAPGLPDNLVATVTGTGKGRILIIAHSDTVFEKGEAAKRPFSISGDTATGAGVMDEKGGVAAAVMALKVLKSLNYRNFKSITLLVETSEELGSTGTRKLIDRLLQGADLELNMEPEEKDTVTVWRKSSGSLVLTVTGRAAHAGMDPEKGRNAAEELISQVRRLDQAFPRSGDQITVNLTLMNAGSRSNIIPAEATGTLNVRGRTMDDMKSVESAARAFAASPTVPDTTVKVDFSLAFPPLVQNPRVMAIAMRARDIQGEIGRPLNFGGNGGASESALADAAGVPALDGLGSTGSGAHTPHETLDLASVKPRLYLLVRLLETYGAQPPSKNP